MQGNFLVFFDDNHPGDFFSVSGAEERKEGGGKVSKTTCLESVLLSDGQHVSVRDFIEC